MANVAGLMPMVLTSRKGILDPDELRAAIRPPNLHHPIPRLVCLENTHNLSGGRVVALEIQTRLCQVAHERGLAVHLDGARIFNAAVALGKTVGDITRNCDSLMFCLSKGLGAPVGSMLVGSNEFIQKAHIVRKMLGGGMRQVGVLAAAGLIALEESPKNLHRDHENARVLAEGLAKTKGISIDAAKVVTNIVIFDVRGTGRTAAEFCSELGKKKILCGPTDKYSVRMVTHCDVACERIQDALASVHEVLSVRAPAAAHS